LALTQKIFRATIALPYINGALRLANSHLDARPQSGTMWTGSDSQARRIAANIAKLPDL
jgi:hypothetical protein